MYCYLLLFVFVIKCSTSLEDSFTWTFHCAYEVTQRIPTGSVIPRGKSIQKKTHTRTTYVPSGQFFVFFNFEEAMRTQVSRKDTNIQVHIHSTEVQSGGDRK